MPESIALAQLKGLLEHGAQLVYVLPPDGALRHARPGIGSGSLAAILITGASIAVGALTAAVLVRRLRTPAAAT
jgi:hypothetical protein